MQFHQLEDPNTINKSIITFGNFDGIHLGHKYLINNLISLSANNNLKSVLITFDPHTNRTLVDKNLKVITPFTKKKEILLDYNIDIVCKINFNKKFSQLNADAFMDLLIGKYNPKIILIGYDNFFGFKKSGSFNYLKKSDKYKNIEILALNQYTFNNKNVKSSIIKDMILNRDIAEVNTFIGRLFSIDGKVIRGEKLSKLTGFKQQILK